MPTPTRVDRLSPRLVALGPEPRRLWIRYAPRAWPGPPGGWVDFARCSLGRPEPGAGAAVRGRLDDLLYLPPVDPPHAAARLRAAEERLAEGTPVLWQRSPGDGAGAPAGATVVWDLLAPLLAGEPSALGELPGGAAAVWPLVPGLTGDPDLWERGCQALAGAGVGWVQAMTLALSPADRRVLASGRSEAVFQALFHRPAPAERDFARVAARWGLAPFLERPLPRPPLLGAGNRRLAGALLLASELWLSADRPVGKGLELARAGRWVDASPYDVAALAREGNLGVVAEIDELSRGVIEAGAAGGAIPLLAELEAEYLGLSPPSRA